MSTSETENLVNVADVEGFQHRDDNYWYRPLILGQKLFTYVAHVPPGGAMSAHLDEDEFETSMYMLEGGLEITHGEEIFSIKSDMALYIPPGVALGVANHGEVTASFVLTFSPPPDLASLSEFRKKFVERGGNIKTTGEMRDLIANPAR